ncbi:uncharacterized protein EV154DRAFT_493249 [Mucor mucedo]|uniref:uncharacterized protein n=1 Tax=Mucor mucedo TaxID=29922 RepID=UPI00221FE6AE|nr:uncharacterized protein EV154DRAFT_493249 [Mucor mucedo]KAI7896027.1 hypothetical protein EV154DRAFT_493249 [Mucor mucedo]
MRWGLLLLSRRVLRQPYPFREMSTSALIIEQLNPLANEQDAKFNIATGNTSFKDFILAYPSGAYTGMRTVHRDSIVEFNTHMSRITNSVSQLFSKDKKAESVMSPFRDVKQFEAMAVPMLKKGLEAYYNTVDETTHSSHPFEAKVSIVVTYSSEKEAPLFAAHFSQLHSIPSDKRVKVDIEQESRKAPEVKDSQWVRDRSQLEEKKSSEINEVLLMDDHEQLYEGIASNFLAVKMVNDKPVVMCASLDHILLGSILKIVLTLCEKHHIDFEWTFPKLQDARDGKWVGCFITSTSRLLLPIETIYFHDERYIFRLPHAANSCY